MGQGNDSYQRLLQYSFWLLGRKNYSEFEMGQKLMRRGKKLKLAELEISIKKIIVRLKELAYLDDGKILDNYFEYRLNNRPVGKFVFMQEMRRRGISREDANAAWEKRNINEKSLALELIEKKKKNLEKFSKLASHDRKKKIVQLLASRGFSPDVIWSTLETYH